MIETANAIKANNSFMSMQFNFLFFLENLKRGTSGSCHTQSNCFMFNCDGMMQFILDFNFYYLDHSVR